mgnify:CR=1 FL=1
MLSRRSQMPQRHKLADPYPPYLVDPLPATVRQLVRRVRAELEKAAAQGCANAEFVVGSAHHARWPERAFDAVLAFNLLHLLTERPALFAKSTGLLKPGGLFITKAPCLAEMSGLIRLAVPVLRVIGKAPNVEFFTAAELLNEIEAAGFTVVEQARHGSQRKDARIFIVAKSRH